ncbi:MAG: hypothetical protein HZC40_14175 [Chloroflexi bacterium]|nr:hypothetical protein [Chloroflexota bacterium]
MTTLKCATACDVSALTLCIIACPNAHALNQPSRVECQPIVEESNDADALCIEFDSTSAPRKE